MAATDVYELIARRAYELYETRGKAPGDELADWLTAEREIMASTNLGKSEAAVSIDNSAAPLAREPRRKAAKEVATVESPKKTSPASPRLPAKPKGAYPSGA
jgi:hypothetical protein